MTVHLDLPITSDEAYEYLKNPRGKTAKELRRYLSDVMSTLCAKCLEKQKEVDKGN
ncbi:MAG: A10/OS-D family protein [Acetobacter sp.]|nr:A10/OS-D family protein [Acetobacter sp.]